MAQPMMMPDMSMDAPMMSSTDSVVVAAYSSFMAQN
jgi:hypothetical protein